MREGNRQRQRERARQVQKGRDILLSLFKSMVDEWLTKKKILTWNLKNYPLKEKVT